MASLSPIHIKLADFGVSKSTIDTSLKTQCGTRGYLAPEVLGLLPRNLHQGRNYTNAVDLWALGCLIYELLSLKTPFSQLESDTTYTGIASDVPRLLEVDTMILTQFCSGQISLPTEALENYKVSNDCIYIVRQLLIADPHSRISAEDALDSEWLLDLSDLLTDYGAIQSQLLSLGVDVSLQVANKMLMHYRGLTKMDPREVLPPDTDPIPLVDTAISSGYVFLSKVLLRIWAKAGSGKREWRHHGLTLLQRAAEVGNPRIVNILIEDGMDVNATPYNEHGRTALQAAAQHGHLKTVELLLKKNANVNAGPCYAYGRTALQAASEGGHLDIVGLLLENGADVNAQPCNFWGKTAIQAAEEGLHSEVARLLLENGAEPLEWNILMEPEGEQPSPFTRTVR